MRAARSSFALLHLAIGVFRRTGGWVRWPCVVFCFSPSLKVRRQMICSLVGKSCCGVEENVGPERMSYSAPPKLAPHCSHCPTNTVPRCAFFFGMSQEKRPLMRYDEASEKWAYVVKGKGPEKVHLS